MNVTFKFLAIAMVYCPECGLALIASENRTLFCDNERCEKFHKHYKIPTIELEPAEE